MLLHFWFIYDSVIQIVIYVQLLLTKFRPRYRMKKIDRGIKKGGQDNG